MNVKELLLILNQKSCQYHVKYLLQYEYQYNHKTDNIFHRIFILKFANYKVLAKTRFRNDVELFAYVEKELLAYN